MEECVKTLVCRQMRRNGHHKVRIDDRNGREALLTAAADLFLAVGDNGERVSLRARACGRWNGNNRQSGIDHALAAARAAVNVVPPVAVVGRHNGNRLGRVDGRAAAETDNKCNVLLTAERSALAHALDRRVRLYLVVYHGRVTGLRQRICHLGYIAQFGGGGAAGDDQTRALRQTYLGQTLDRSGTEK